MLNQTQKPQKATVMKGPSMVNVLWVALNLVVLVVVGLALNAASLVLRGLGFGRRSELRFREPFTRS